MNTSARAENSIQNVTRRPTIMPAAIMTGFMSQVMVQSDAW